MVIKSFEGGCPAATMGNLGGGEKSPDPFHFNFTIPTDIPTGKYTLAWTWFNRVGDREMYMNCAPINVSGGSEKRDEILDVDHDFFKRDDSKYPPMFVANINGCTTKESKAIRFPNPGPNVQLGQENELQSVGEEACTGDAKFGGDGMKPGAGGGGGGPSPTSVSPSNGGESSTPAPEPSSSSSPNAGSEPSSTPTPSSSDSSPSSSPTGSGQTMTGSCSPEGDWNCVGGSSFQRCSQGKWTGVEQLATGTSCKVGQTKNLEVQAAPESNSSSSADGSDDSDLKPRYFESVRRHHRRHLAHAVHHHGS